MEDQKNLRKNGLISPPASRRPLPITPPTLTKENMVLMTNSKPVPPPRPRPQILETQKPAQKIGVLGSMTEMNDTENKISNSNKINETPAIQKPKNANGVIVQPVRTEQLPPRPKPTVPQNGSAPQQIYKPSTPQKPTLQTNLIQNKSLETNSNLVHKPPHSALSRPLPQTSNHSPSIQTNSSNSQATNQPETMPRKASKSEGSQTGNNIESATTMKVESLPQLPISPESQITKNLAVSSDPVLQTSPASPLLSPNIKSQLKPSSPHKPITAPKNPYLPSKTVIQWMPLDSVFDQGESDKIASPHIIIVDAHKPAKQNVVVYMDDSKETFPAYTIPSQKELNRNYCNTPKQPAEKVDTFRIIEEVTNTISRGEPNEPVKHEEPKVEQPLPDTMNASPKEKKYGWKTIKVLSPTKEKRNKDQPTKHRKTKTLENNTIQPRHGPDPEFIAKYKSYFNLGDEDCKELHQPSQTPNSDLPPNWIQCSTQDGKSYYCNQSSGETAWEIPNTNNPSKSKNSQQSSAAPPPVPEGSRKAKQDLILEEILATEKTYVEGLKLVIELYYKPLKEKKILNEEELKNIFSNIQALFNVNNQLLADLETYAKEKPDSMEQLISIFYQMVPFLKLYVSYLRDQPIAIEKLNSLQKSNKDFRSHCQAMKMNPNSKHLSLSDYLITPLQRLTRYPLLLSELQGTINEKHPSYELLNQIIIQLKQVVVKSNDSQRNQSEQQQK